MLQVNDAHVDSAAEDRAFDEIRSSIGVTVFSQVSLKEKGLSASEILGLADHGSAGFSAENAVISKSLLAMTIDLLGTLKADTDVERRLRDLYFSDTVIETNAVAAPAAKRIRIRYPFLLWDSPDADFPPNYAKGWNDATNYSRTLNGEE